MKKNKEISTQNPYKIYETRVWTCKSLYTISLLFISSFKFHRKALANRSSIPRLHLSPSKVAGTTGLCIIAPIQAWTLTTAAWISWDSLRPIKTNRSYSIHGVSMPGFFSRIWLTEIHKIHGILTKVIQKHEQLIGTKRISDDNFTSTTSFQTRWN